MNANILPKQYAELQVSSGLSLYTRKVEQFFTSISYEVSQLSEKPTLHAVKVWVIPSGGVGSKNKINKIKDVHECIKLFQNINHKYSYWFVHVK